MGIPRRLLFVLFLLLSACGRSASADAEDIRRVLAQVLESAATGARSTAMSYTNPREFVAATLQSVPKPWDQHSAAERAQIEDQLWGQIQAVPKETLLREPASIAASVAAARVTVQSRIRRAEVAFAGTPAEGRGLPITYRVAFSLGNDGAWRVISVEPQYGR